VPYLNAVPVLGRETAQETGESAEAGGAEGRWQLNPERMRPPPEGFDRAQEGAERVGDIGQAALMGDLPRQFLRTNRKSGVVCSAHDLTVSRAGVA